MSSFEDILTQADITGCTVSLSNNRGQWVSGPNNVPRHECRLWIIGPPKRHLLVASADNDNRGDIVEWRSEGIVDVSAPTFSELLTAAEKQLRERGSEIKEKEKD